MTTKNILDTIAKYELQMKQLEREYALLTGGVQALKVLLSTEDSDESDTVSEEEQK